MDRRGSRQGSSVSALPPTSGTAGSASGLFLHDSVRSLITSLHCTLTDHEAQPRGSLDPTEPEPEPFVTRAPAQSTGAGDSRTTSRAEDAAAAAGEIAARVGTPCGNRLWPLIQLLPPPWLRHAVGPVEIVGPDAVGQAVVGAVDQLDGLVLVANFIRYETGPKIPPCRRRCPGRPSAWPLDVEALRMIRDCRSPAGQDSLCSCDCPVCR